jgi:hypothetical protein
MSSEALSGLSVSTALAECWGLPPETASVEILIPADGVFQLRYAVNIRLEDLPKLAKTFERIEEIQKQNEEKHREYLRKGGLIK